MGSTAVLVDVLSKTFKARNTGVPETIRIQWKKGEGADVYTLSDLTKTEHVTHAYTPRKVYETELGYANLKITYIHTYIHPADFHCSCRRPVETRYRLLQPVPPQQATKRPSEL
jgi:hypothetical protein